MKLIIGYLYGDLMNIYGDTGNIIALKKRAGWRGIEIKVRVKNQESRIKSKECDLFFFGGGQDQAQTQVASDLESSGKGKVIREEVERGVPLLSICGGYQLLGEYYKPFDSKKLPGVGLFPAYTEASNDRMIGNIVIKVDSLQFTVSSLNHEPTNQLTDNYLVGFENHSGKTYLKKGASPLGMIVKGFGNNGGLPAMQDGKALQAGDKTEGCIYKNAVGCYMHGSLLPKNPKLADWLLQKALEIKYGKDITLEPLDDTLENQAHQAAIKKFG